MPKRRDIKGNDILELSRQFSMAPIGGLFLATVGATLILGGLLPRMRGRSIWIGFALGVMAVALFGGRLLVPPPPTLIQLASLALAIAVEVAAFVVLMPRLYRAGERAVVTGTLAIVGGHFVLMLPALGPLIAAMGMLCVANAALLWLSARYALKMGWTADGAIKLSFGLVMLQGM